MKAVAITLATAAWCLVACDSAEPEAAIPAPGSAAVPMPSALSAEPAFPALTGRVVDEADLLAPDEERQLVAALTGLEARTSDQLLVVTVRDLGGRDISEFGTALGNHWQIGHGDRDNGVLLIVAPSERKTRIAVGYGLEPILTDARARQIIDREMLPRFRDARWQEGIRAGTEAIIATLIAQESEPRRGRP